MKFIKLLDERVEEILLIILTIIIVLLTFLQVIMRELGNSLTWSEELVRYSFIWLVYIGVSYGVKKNKHIAIDVLFVVANDKWKKIINIISHTLFLVFSLMVVYYGTKISLKILDYEQMSAALGVPVGLIYLATPIGFALTSIRLVQKLFQVIKEPVAIAQPNSMMDHHLSNITPVNKTVVKEEI